MKKFTEEIEAGLKEEFSTENYRSLFYETYKNYDISTLKGEIEGNLDKMEEILSKFENKEYRYKRNFNPDSKAFAIVNEQVYEYLKSYAIVKAGYELLMQMCEKYQKKYIELKESGVPVDEKTTIPNWDEPILDDEMLEDYDIKKSLEEDASNYLFSDLNSYFVKWANIAGLHDITAYLKNIKTEMKEDNEKLATLIPVIASKLTIYIDENLYYLLRLGHKIINTENRVD